MYTCEIHLFPMTQTLFHIIIITWTKIQLEKVGSPCPQLMINNETGLSSAVTGSLSVEYELFVAHFFSE